MWRVTVPEIPWPSSIDESVPLPGGGLAIKRTHVVPIVLSYSVLRGLAIAEGRPPANRGEHRREFRCADRPINRVPPPAEQFGSAQNESQKKRPRSMKPRPLNSPHATELHPLAATPRGGRNVSLSQLPRYPRRTSHGPVVDAEACEPVNRRAKPLCISGALGLTTIIVSLAARRFEVKYQVFHVEPQLA